MGEVEKYGTGFIRIRDWLKEYPELSRNLNDTGGVTRVDICVNGMDEKTKTDRVTDNQQKIIELMKENNQISTSQIAENIGISKRKVIDNINKLKDLDLIKRIGPAKGGHWETL